MSAHVPPHHWADALHGRIDDAEREAMDRHAESCEKCARTKARVQRASDTFSTIRTQVAPELSWDAVRAKVHWSVSTERRAKVAPRASRVGWVAVVAAAAAATIGVVAIDRTEPAAPIAIAPVAPEIAPKTVPKAPTAEVAGLVTRATGDVLIDGLRPDDLFARKLGAGSVLATGEGRVDVQFGNASAFALAPHSMLELRKLDAMTVELVIEGTVDIEVAPRTNQQRFVVLAGDRTIEVRGTQFRVRHDKEATTVACRHGLVAVRDPSGLLEVGAARAVEVKAGRRVAGHQVTALSTSDVTALADARPMTLPIWDLDTLVQTSAPLEIATVGRRDIRVDGVELGRAPMAVRVMPGRHTVEAADRAGRFKRAGWIDVAAPTAGARPARLEVPAESVPTRDTTARRRQLKNGIDKARIAACTRQLAKSADLAGAYVQIELSVDARGAVGFLNVIETDLPKDTADCVRRVLADVAFSTGAAATWRERIAL